jgi:hypothetical protein
MLLSLGLLDGCSDMVVVAAAAHQLQFNAKLSYEERVCCAGLLSQFCKVLLKGPTNDAQRVVGCCACVSAAACV